MLNRAISPIPPAPLPAGKGGRSEAAGGGGCYLP